jgi:hypothetical protein
VVYVGPGPGTRERGGVEHHRLTLNPIACHETTRDP